MNFAPPTGYASSFAGWAKGIGAAAYQSWLRGAQSWVGLDGTIHIKAASPFKARWIRSNYVTFLERIVACPVIISSDEDTSASRYWPHGGPKGGSECAWFNYNKWWKGDKQPGNASIFEEIAQRCTKEHE